MKKGGELFLAVSVLVVFMMAFLITGQADKKTTQEKSGAIEISDSDFDFGDGQKDEIITDDKVITSGDYKYKNFTLDGARLMALEGTKSIIKIYATESINIKDGSVIDLSASGNSYKKINEEEQHQTGNGGTLGGSGGSGDCLNSSLAEVGQIFTLVSVLGEAGQTAKDKTEIVGGEGGGFLLLSAPHIIINGKIMASGADGKSNIGGGSGGKIVIMSKKIEHNGQIIANGGAGNSGQIQGFGGGGGGIIIFASNPQGSGEVTVKGGKGGMALDIYTGCNGGDGQPGKIIYRKNP